MNRGSFGTGLWKEIRKKWETLYGNTRFLIGNDSKVSFWKDLWCGDEALCSTFPTLFNLVVHKEALVRDAWDNSGGGGSSFPYFTRSFNDLEKVEVEN